MSTNPDLRKRLVYSILEFLNDSIKDGIVRADDQESMEVAMQCISESFSVDWDASSSSSLSIKPSTLLNLFEVFVNTQNKRVGSSSGTSGNEKLSSTPSETTRKEADALKSDGNLLLSQKKFSEAIEKYTKAIQLDPTNPVYYSNRAAAQSQLGAHDEAIEDALKALEVDPGFIKAYSRLGHGYFCSGKYEKAVEAYEKGLQLEPENDTIRKSLATAKSKLPSSEEASSSTSAANNSGDSLSRDLPNFGGAGGMPDLASLMNNPMMAQMAQSLMANGGLERMMQNPMVQQMMSSMGGAGGNGMPDISQLMNNPAAREMAASLMGGMGQAPPGSGDQNSNPNSRS
ncbi:small glutamine-rich tetratricopeptide repeat-containing protein A [Phakopsora pachyrhizi]|nr:small glutamine-rich tetratricopeptide repeat-containing protein A [Phakopsora pachyrhizi]